MQTHVPTPATSTRAHTIHTYSMLMYTAGKYVQYAHALTAVGAHAQAPPRLLHIPCIHVLHVGRADAQALCVQVVVVLVQCPLRQPAESARKSTE